MAIKQTVTGDLVTTESDSGHYIIRDDVRYESAVDPVGSGRTYTESDDLIPVPEVPPDA